MKRKPITLHEDAGHGWYAVKRRALKELGLLSSITRFSYQKGDTVYLEEDCDATLFFESIRAIFGLKEPVRVKLGDVHIAKFYNSSPIRNYESFLYDPERDGF